MNLTAAQAKTDSGEAAAAQILVERLQQKEYLRQRLHPHWRDLECLILQDLRDVVLLLCRDQRGRLLDFGCGGSPYAGILPQFSQYIRADITSGEGIDLVTDSKGLLPGEPSASYDVVFSTQVLEHVAEPQVYLSEAYRLLRPGGTLVLSTHGLFPEHGCPYDFYRWTGYGLQRVVEDAGFVVEENYKFTAGFRASISFLHMIFFNQLNLPDGKIGNFLLKLVRRFYQIFLVGPLNLLGQMARNQSMVPNHLNRETLYIGVAMRARKPASAS